MSMLNLADNPDPLGVLSSTLPIVQGAASVTINFDALHRLARSILDQEFALPAWNNDIHWHGDPHETAMFIFVLDALNFCFWGEPRWTILHHGQSYNGYSALALALTRAVTAGVPLLDPYFLIDLDASTLARILAGENTIPLLAERAANLRELGRVLIDHYRGSFAQLLHDSDNSAVQLIAHVITHFKSFNDVAISRGREIRFYKRAQILASDLANALTKDATATFHDVALLTAFADYKIPQVLHHLNVLHYTPSLVHLLQSNIELPCGDLPELEIRSATIWAIEMLSRELRRRGADLWPYQLDSILWQLGQSLSPDVLPYHRTRTIYY